MHMEISVEGVRHTEHSYHREWIAFRHPCRGRGVTIDHTIDQNAAGHCRESTEPGGQNPFRKPKPNHNVIDDIPRKNVETFDNIQNHTAWPETFGILAVQIISKEVPDSTRWKVRGNQRCTQRSTVPHTISSSHTSPHSVKNTGNTYRPKKCPVRGLCLRLPQDNQEPFWQLFGPSQPTSLHSVVNNQQDFNQRFREDFQVRDRPVICPTHGGDLRCLKGLPPVCDRKGTEINFRVGRQWLKVRDVLPSDFILIITVPISWPIRQEMRGPHIGVGGNKILGEVRSTWRESPCLSSTRTWKSSPTRVSPTEKAKWLATWNQDLPVGSHRWGESFNSSITRKLRTWGNACSRKHRKAFLPPSDFIEISSWEENSSFFSFHCWAASLLE